MITSTFCQIKIKLRSLKKPIEFELNQIQYDNLLNSLGNDSKSIINIGPFTFAKSEFCYMIKN